MSAPKPNPQPVGEDRACARILYSRKESPREMAMRVTVEAFRLALRHAQDRRLNVPAEGARA